LYDGLKHEPLDGFVKNKEECYIVLPGIFKNQNDVANKALILDINYEIPN